MVKCSDPPSVSRQLAISQLALRAVHWPPSCKRSATITLRIKMQRGSVRSDVRLIYAVKYQPVKDKHFVKKVHKCTNNVVSLTYVRGLCAYAMLILV